MTGMEAAIRGALEKAGIPGAQARQRIYDSARGALDRSLERQGITDAARIAEHRHRLELLIADIEAEWTPPGEADAPAIPAVDQPVAPAVSPAPAIPGQTGRSHHVEPAWTEPAAVAPQSGLGAAPAVGPASGPARQQEAPRGEASLDIAPGAGPYPASEAFAVDASLDAERPPHIAAPSGKQAKPAKPAKKVTIPKARKQKPRRGVFASIFSAAVMLSFLGIGVWWVIESGALKSAAERDTGVPNPPPSLSRDDYAGGPQQLNPGAGFSGEWANVFQPGRDGELRSRGNEASVELIEQPDGDVLRIVSRTGGPGGEVLIPLGAEVMQALAGRQSVLALTVRSASPEPTQIYVKCEFSVLGDCGRHRFDVTYDTTDVLFNLDYDRALAPNEGGNLVINSDISGSGKGIDLIAVRIKPLT
ncbi:MAG: hypothetical protein ABJN75_08480 [Hoeflea sp.]|uniref:hypothetical protein n=1 Tax=Hoeflea sp. TaxID=1940281 RepID=UPI003298975D